MSTTRLERRAPLVEARPRPLEPPERILVDLGIYGYEEAATPVIAALLGEQPLLLVGTHGSGKTLLCERLAQALGCSFIAYDASKALFEDILGFPNPQQLAAGRVEYVTTPLSIWDKTFVLVDELSRAAPEMQNKWLEVVRSRRVMGLEIPELRYVFAAMNPPEYLGTYALDPALLGRFAFFLYPPEFSELGWEDRRRVVHGEVETPSPERYVRVGAGLRALLAAAQARRAAFGADLDATLTEYLVLLQEELRRNDLALDGRRIALMYKALRDCLAVHAAASGTDPDPLAAVQTWLPYLVPPGEQGRVDPARLVAAHFAVTRHMRAGNGLPPAPEPHPLVAARQALEATLDDPIAFRRELERIWLERNDQKGDFEATVVAQWAFELVVDWICSRPLPIGGQDALEILADFYRRVVLQRCCPFDGQAPLVSTQLGDAARLRALHVAQLYQTQDTDLVGRVLTTLECWAHTMPPQEEERR